MLPFFLVVGVVGPIVTLIALMWVWYLLHRTPRPRPPRGAPGDGRADRRRRPAGLPGERALLRGAWRSSTRPRVSRCEVDRADLSVACPVDGTSGPRAIQTCPACGTRYVLGAASSPDARDRRRRPARGRRGRRLTAIRASRSPRPDGDLPDAMTLATVSQYLFVVAAITLLPRASWRRSPRRRCARSVGGPRPSSPADGLRLAGASVTVGGGGTSGTDRARARRASAGRDRRGHRPRPALGHAAAPRREHGHARAHRRPRAVGQHVRVLDRVRDRDRRRVPPARAALPDPLDRLRAGRRRARARRLRAHAAGRDRAARAGARQPAAAHDPRGDGHDQLRHLRDLVRGRASPTSPRATATASPGCRPGACSTRSPTARSSSASRSSRR